MKTWHGILLGIVVGYIIAIYFPGPGNKLKAKITGAVGG